jgi:hypothetical protein
MTLLFMAFALVLAIPAVALADDISNNLDTTIDATVEQTSVDAGSTKTVGFYVQPRNGDGENGCNFGGSGPQKLVVDVESDNPAVATVSPSELTFNSCGDTPSVTVTGVSAGTATISLSETSNNTGGSFNLAPATFSITVNQTQQATSLSVSANPTSAHYGDNVDLTATLTKTSDNSAISDKTVTFTDNGHSIGNAQTNASGQATLSRNDLSVGSHSIKASFAGDNDYLGSNAGPTNVNILAWTISGFHKPVDMGILNDAKGGATVPLKFNVFKGATELTNTSVVNTFTQKIVCAAGAGDAIEEYATGNTSLRYDGTPGADGQFIFNWKTPKSPGSCYRVTLETKDGTPIYADFRLK